ncbi:MAG: PorT family protein [Fibrobacter sp.]|nr:PorT family protein [Fibrobacter sp.]
MNIRFTSVMAVLATAATVFAAEPAAPTAEAAAPAAKATAVEAPAAAEAPAAEVAAPAVEPAPAAEVAAVEETGPAPTAVRGGSSAKPTKTIVVESRPATTNAYSQQTVQSEAAAAPAKRGRSYEPQKLAYGVQAFVGSYFFMDDFFDYDMSGMTWRVGPHLVLPLNDYTSALKIALLYEQSDASTSDDNSYSTSRKIKQRKLNIPVLFDFKGPRSIVSFGVGASVDIPLTDTFSYICKGVDTEKFGNSKHTGGVGGKHKFDMMDEDHDQRKSVDYSLLLGLSIRPHKMLSFDLRYELGLNKLYEDDFDLGVDNTSSAFTLGLSFYVP